MRFRAALLAATLFATPALRVAWTALEGAAMWVGPSLGPEGHVYALCETGFECRPDAEGVPTCQAL